MDMNPWRSFLQKFWWLVVLGILYGVTIVLDPFIRSRYYLEEELGSFVRFWNYPYIPTILFLILPIVCTLLFRKINSMSRVQRDQILLLVVLSTMFINYWGLIHVHLSFILMFIVAFIFFIRGAMAGRYDFTVLPVDIYYFIFFFLMVFSLFSPLASPLGVIANALSFLVSVGIPVFFLHNAIRTRKQLERCIHFLIYLAIFSSSIGILQFIAYKVLGVDITGNWNVELGRRVSLPVLGEFLRVAALTGNSNYLGFSTGTMTVFFTSMIFSPYYISRKWRKVLLVGIILGLLTTVFSASRGSWLSLIICYTIMPFMIYPKYAHYFLLALFLIGMIGIFSGLFEYLYDVVYQIRPQAVYYRDRLFLIGLDAVRHYPLTGTGFGFFGRYWNYHDADPHNLWLNFASQIGVLGALVLFIYFISIVYRLFRAFLRSRGFNRIVLRSLFLCLIFFIVTSMVRPLIWDKFFWIFFGFCETAIWILGRVKERSMIYYPIFGYSWRDEPARQLKRRS